MPGALACYEAPSVSAGSRPSSKPKTTAKARGCVACNHGSSFTVTGHSTTWIMSQRRHRQLIPPALEAQAYYTSHSVQIPNPSPEQDPLESGCRDRAHRVPGSLRFPMECVAHTSQPVVILEAGEAAGGSSPDRKVPRNGACCKVKKGQEMWGPRAQLY